MGQEKLLELLNTYAKSSYEIDDNFTLDYIKEKIQFLDAWIQDNIEKTPRDLFRLTEEQLIENRNKITETEINNITLSEEETEGLTEEEIIEKKKDKILANQIKGEAFWKDSTQQLIDFFQEEFIPLLNENDANNSEETKYSENMKIIKNRHRINVEDLNDNFKLITEGLKRIFENVLSDKKGIYKNFFKLVLSDLVPLWENVLFLWIMYILKNADFNVKPLVKYVYLNENDFFPSKKFDFLNNIHKDITLLDITNKIKKYIHEYQNCNLIIIPIIRLNNYENNYYSQEAYPGIFYHPAILNNKLFKTNEKFIIYPFSTMSGEKIDTFTEGTYVTVTTENKNAKNYFCLGEKVYGYTINGDDLYYIAPFNNINNLKEIFPKKYYNAIRTVLETDVQQSNSKLMLKNFTIKCYDAFQENLKNNNCKVGSITLFNNADITLNTVIDLLKEKDISIQSPLGCIFNYELGASEILHKISNFRVRLGRDNNLAIKNLKFYQGECISYYQYSLDEDYSYLIEYIPFKSENNREDLILEEDLNQIKNNYVGDITSTSTLGYKDNDLLQKHFVWDNKKNNILEDKFVLRIGQHLEKDSLINSDKTILISDYLKQQDRKYFDYDSNNEIQELNKQESFYNSGTIEVGAYLNIPFIKNKKDRIIYYPEFLSHTFGSDYLIPTETVEYKDNIPDYFANKTLYRNYDINKDCYFQIYTKNGDEDFSDDWSIKMIEVISQTTPIERTYGNSIFEDSYLLPPEKTRTMDEIYNFYFNNNQYKENYPSISDTFKTILPFFSQLCPTSSEKSVRTLSLTQYYDPLNIQIKKDYKEIVDFFFDDLDEAEKEQVYKEITNSLFFTYENNNIYPMIFTRSRSFTNFPYTNEFKYSLSILSGISESEILNNAISDGRINRAHWNETARTFTDTTVEKESYDLIYQCPTEYRGYYYEADNTFYRAWIRTDFVPINGDYDAQIAKWESEGWCVYEYTFDSQNKKYFELLCGGENEPWNDGIYPIIPYTNRLDKELYEAGTVNQQQQFVQEQTFFPPLCKQAYLVEGGNKTLINVTEEPIIKTNFPQTQIVEQGIDKGEVLDEIYLKDYWEQEKLKYDGSQYIYYGFTSVSNFEIMDYHTDPQYGNLATIPFKTMIFGANIPLIKQDEVYSNRRRLTDMEKTGLKTKTWKDEDYMYGEAQTGDMLGGLLSPPAYHAGESNATSFTRGLYGTQSFKKINFALDVIPYHEMEALYNDITYDKRTKLSFNQFTSTPIAPFFKVFYIPHLNYNALQIRQYPHIFLYSKKTMFPKLYYLRNHTLKKVSYQIYKDLNKNIASLRNFYQKLSQSDSEKIPYPYPTFKDNITIKFAQKSALNWDTTPSLSKAFETLFTKNFITNYNTNKSHKPNAPLVLNSAPCMPCYLDYSAKKDYSKIENTTLSLGFTNMISMTFQRRKFSPIDIFENRYLYHNRYNGTTTTLDNIIHRPLFYNILKEMQDSLQSIANGNTDSYKDFGVSQNSFKIDFASIYQIDHDNSEERTVYTNTYKPFPNIDTPLSYQKEDSSVYSINLQIITHWFGPNGKYARKVSTRQTTGTPLNKDYFILGEHDFTYREWTNTWATSTYDNGYSFVQFENDLANQSLFKQSTALNTFNFEIYKNNGIDH